MPPLRTVKHGASESMKTFDVRHFGEMQATRGANQNLGVVFNLSVLSFESTDIEILFGIPISFEELVSKLEMTAKRVLGGYVIQIF